MYIWLNSTDEYYKEEFIENSTTCCIGCIPDYTFGDYFYFRNNTDQSEIYHRVWIFNHIPDMNITSPFNFLAENFVSFPKLFVEKCLNHGLIQISKLLLSYQEMMYGTHISTNGRNV